MTPRDPPRWVRPPPSRSVPGVATPVVRLHDAIDALFVEHSGAAPPIEFVQWPMRELVDGDAGLRIAWRYPRPAALAEFKPSKDVIDPETMASLDSACTLEPTAATWCHELYRICGELYRAVVRKEDPVPLFRRPASPSNSRELRRVTGVHEFGGVTDWWRALFPPDFGDDQPWQMTLDDARWVGCVRLPLRGSIPRSPSPKRPHTAALPLQPSRRCAAAEAVRPTSSSVAASSTRFATSTGGSPHVASATPPTPRPLPPAMEVRSDRHQA